MSFTEKVLAACFVLLLWGAVLPEQEGWGAMASTHVIVRRQFTGRLVIAPPSHRLGHHPLRGPVHRCNPGSWTHDGSASFVLPRVRPQPR
jgi:hypothetical protein